jgi:hypothetical protein
MLQYVSQSRYPLPLSVRLFGFHQKLGRLLVCIAFTFCVQGDIRFSGFAESVAAVSAQVALYAGTVFIEES